MSFESSATKAAKKSISNKENKQKETKDMKTKFERTTKFLTTILPWLVLLSLVTGFIGASAGYERGKHDQKSVNAEVVKQVADLKVTEQ